MTTTTTEAARRCAEKGCRSAATARNGKTGPHPRRCAEHTAARIRELKKHPRKPRGGYPECCLDHRAAGGTGKCPQCAEWAAEKWVPVSDLNEREVSFLIGALDASRENIGFTVTGPALPRWWNSDTGPWEGRTAGDVFNADPRRDDTAKGFYGAYRRWWDFGDD